MAIVRIDTNKPIELAGRHISVPEDGELRARTAVILKWLDDSGFDYQLDTDEGLSREDKKNRDYLRSRGCEFLANQGLEVPKLNKERCLELMNEEDYEVFSQTILPYILAFLESPIIIDGFLDFNQRGAWKKSLPKEAHEYYRRNNKMAVNPLNIVSGYIGHLSNFMKKDEDRKYLDQLSDYLLEKVRKEISKVRVKIKLDNGEAMIPKYDYDSYQLNEKILISRLMEELIVELLKFFSNDLRNKKASD